MGLDVDGVPRRAPRAWSRPAARASAATRIPASCSASLLGVAATQGRDKLTLIASPRHRQLGAWLEQLSPSRPARTARRSSRSISSAPAIRARYGADRVFVYLRLRPAPTRAQDARRRGARPARGSRSCASTSPTRRRSARSSSAGRSRRRSRARVLRHQPVRSARRRGEQDRDAGADHRLRARRQPAGAKTPLLSGDGLTALHRRRERRRAAEGGAGGVTVEAYLARASRAPGAGDYFALLAYVEMNRASCRHAAAHPRTSCAIGDGVATCLGFGPRFLHSTGQAYKGGPDSGVFLQITCDDARDVADSGSALLVRRGEGGAGARRFRRARRTRPPRAPRPSSARDVAAGLQTARATSSESRPVRL